MPISKPNIGLAKQPAKAIVGRPSRAIATFDTKSPTELPQARTYASLLVGYVLREAFTVRINVPILLEYFAIHQRETRGHSTIQEAAI